MYCSKCGNKAEHGDRFCIKCGTKLNFTVEENVETLSQEKIEEIIKDLNDGTVAAFTAAELTVAEKEAVVRIAIKQQDPRLAISILNYLNSVKEHKLTSQEKMELKWTILKSKDTEIACSALLNLGNVFTDPERKTLRDIASKTTNAYWAYGIYREECLELVHEPENRKALRKTVVETNDPKYAFEFLSAQDENLESYDKDLKSLEFSKEELEHFKQIILSSRDVDIAYKLLFSKEQVEKAKKDPDMFDYTFPSVIDLTPNEQEILKKIILESKNAYSAYDILGGLRGNPAVIFTDIERALLREILVQTTNPTVARGVLSNPILSQSLSQEERAHLVGAQNEDSKKREEIKKKWRESNKTPREIE